MESALDGANCDLLLCHSRNDAAREAAEIQTLVSSHIEGLIVAPVQRLKKPGVFDDLSRRGSLFVLVDRFFPGRDFSSVHLDDAAAGRMAMEYLIQLGHKSVALLAGPSNGAGLLRKLGYKAAFATPVSISTRTGQCNRISRLRVLLESLAEDGKLHARSHVFEPAIVPRYSTQQLLNSRR